MGKQHKRNPVARATILRKGGVHEKGRTAKRQHQKRELNDLLDDYYSSAGDGGNRHQNHDKKDHPEWSFFWLVFF